MERRDLLTLYREGMGCSTTQGERSQSPALEIYKPCTVWHVCRLLGFSGVAIEPVTAGGAHSACSKGGPREETPSCDEQSSLFCGSTKKAGGTQWVKIANMASSWGIGRGPGFQPSSESFRNLPQSFYFLVIHSATVSCSPESFLRGT